MSWAGLASNQIVSDTNLANACATGVFVAKTSIPSTGRELTASAAQSYAYVNVSGRASNQLVTKSSLSSAAYNVSLRAKQSTTRAGRYLWYSVNGGSSYTRITSPAVTISDQSFGTIVVGAGVTLILAIGDAIDINDGTTAASVGVGGYAALPSSCPGRVSPPPIYADQTDYLYGNSTSYDLACT
jgi:hypothetical protein